MTSGNLKCLEVPSFERKSNWSGCRRPKTAVFAAFDFLQGCSLQEEVMMSQEMTSRGRARKLSFDRKLPGSGLEYWKLASLVLLTSFKAVAHKNGTNITEMTSRDLRRPELTRNWRHFTGGHLERAVESQKLASLMRLTSYKAVARRRRYSRDIKWHHMTSGDWKWPGSDVIDWKWLAGCRRGPSLVHLTSYKAVDHRRRKSRDSKWHHMTSGTRKWPRSYIIWPEFTWKWL